MCIKEKERESASFQPEAEVCFPLLHKVILLIIKVYNLTAIRRSSFDGAGLMVIALCKVKKGN